MPTPDGRSWLNSTKIGMRIAVFFCDEFRGETWFDGGEPWHIERDIDAEIFDIVPDENLFPASCMLGMPGVKQRFLSAMADGFASTGYTMEFKIVRLIEKLKDATDRGGISDLHDIKMAFRSIYNKDVLDLYDEEGELLP